MPKTDTDLINMYLQKVSQQIADGQKTWDEMPKNCGTMRSGKEEVWFKNSLGGMENLYSLL